MASKRARRRHECGHKHGYPERWMAARSMRLITRDHLDTLHTYLCRWCGQWHVGHIPGFIYRAMRAKV